MDDSRIKGRINRIIGQLRGIGRMVSQGRDCEEILLQISAIKKAIDGLTKTILTSSVCQVIPERERESIEKVISRAVDL